MAERASTKFPISLVSAWQASPETNAKRVMAFLFGSDDNISLVFYLHLDVDECSSYPCQSGGTCTDGTNEYTCVCVSGHTGENCETSNILSFQVYILNNFYIFRR